MNAKKDLVSKVNNLYDKILTNIEFLDIENDEETIRLMTEKHPGYEEHDIPYRCGACMDRDEDNTDTKGD